MLVIVGHLVSDLDSAISRSSVSVFNWHCITYPPQTLQRTFFQALTPFPASPTMASYSFFTNTPAPQHPFGLPALQYPLLTSQPLQHFLILILSEAIPWPFHKDGNTLESGLKACSFPHLARSVGFLLCSGRGSRAKLGVVAHAY